MDNRNINGFVTLLLIWVPVISQQCDFQQAQTTLHKVQSIYDQFKTDMLNQSYTPKPSPQARICSHMKKESPEFQEFNHALKNCSQNVQNNLQRRWDALKADHDQKCNGVSHLRPLLALSLLVWIITFLPQ